MPEYEGNNMNKIMVSISAALFCILSCGPGTLAQDKKPDTGTTPMTFSDLFKAPITQYIDKEFVFKAKTTWKHADVKIPEDPTPESELRKKAGQLLVPFEGAEFKDVKTKAYLHATAADLAKTAGPDGRQVYKIKDTVLSNGDKEYTMTVRLKLRPSFNKSQLENPAFVKQCNNPVYWNQTFELEIVSVQNAP